MLFSHPRMAKMDIPATRTEETQILVLDFRAGKRTQRRDTSVHVSHAPPPIVARLGGPRWTDKYVWQTASTRGGNKKKAQTYPTSLGWRSVLPSALG